MRWRPRRSAAAWATDRERDGEGSGGERARTCCVDACRAPVLSREIEMRDSARRRGSAAMGSRAGGGRFASSPAGGGTAGIRALDEGPGDRMMCDCHAVGPSCRRKMPAVAWRCARASKSVVITHQKARWWHAP